MRNVLLFLIIICMCVTCISYAESSVEEATLVPSEEYNIVVSLGLIDSSCSANAPALRAETVSTMLRLTGLGGVKSEAALFSDVGASHKYASEISTARTIGLINGFGDNTFRPDDEISYSEMINLMVKVLGFKVAAEGKGGWDAGYLAIAANNGLLDGIDSSESVTYDTLARLVVNSFDSNVMEVRYQGDGFVYQVNTEKSILGNIDVVLLEGVVTENEVTALSSAKKNKQGISVIDGNGVVSSEELDEYLGLRVRAYVKDAENPSDRTVYYVKPYGNGDVLMVQADDIYDDDSAFSAYNMVYNKGNDKAASFSIAKDADVIYNGIASLARAKEMIAPESGFVTLIDNNNDRKADVVKIVEYEHYLVDSVNLNSMTIYDKFGRSLKLYEDDEENIIVEKLGEISSLNAIVEWDVLSVTDSSAYSSMDSERLIHITVSSDIVTGKVEKTVNKSNGIRYVINGQEYMISDDFVTGASARVTMPEIGDEGSFYLTIDDRIIGFNEGSLAVAMKEFGFFVASGPVDEPFATDTRVKIFTTEGKMTVYNVKDNIKVDGQFVKEENLSGVLNIPQLIRFTTDSQGQINMIDTATVNNIEGGDSLIQMVSSSEGSLEFRKDYNKFDKAIVDGNTVYFLVPNNIANDSAYSIVNKSYFVDQQKYAIDAYLLNERQIPCSAVVYRTDAVESYNLNHMFFVGDMLVTMDENGDVVGKIEGLDYSGKKTYYTNPEVIKNSIFEKGDVIVVKTEGNGQVYEAELVYDADKQTIASDMSSYKGTVHLSGIYLKNNGYMALCSDPTLVSNHFSLTKYAFSLFGSNCVMYDVENETYTVPKISDIIDYVTDPVNYTRILYVNAGARFAVFYSNAGL